MTAKASFQTGMFVYLFVLLLAAIAGVWRAWQDSSPSLRIMAVLLAMTFTVEFAGMLSALAGRNNAIMFNGFGIFQIFLTCLYFNETIDVFRRRNTALYIGIASVLIGFTNMFFIQSPDELNNYFLCYEGVVTIGLSLFFFLRLMLADEGGPALRQNTHFQLAASLSFFWAVNFCMWALTGYLLEHKEHFWAIQLGSLSVTTLAYGSMGLAFLRANKRPSKF